jgi:hypothetical protein
MVWNKLDRIQSPPIVTSDFVYLRLIGDRSIRKAILERYKRIEKRKYFTSRNQLFLSLGKSVMYPTITTILDYLEESNKVVFKKDGSIVWIFKGTSKSKKGLKVSRPVRKR